VNPGQITAADIIDWSSFGDIVASLGKRA